MENEEYEKEIDLLKLAKKILKSWKFIIAFVLGFAIISYATTALFIPKKYTTSMTMYVNNREDASNSVNINDINASRGLVPSYLSLLKSDCVLDKIEEKLNNPEYDVEFLRKAIVCQQVNKTEIFEIDVTTTDPYLSKEIADYMKEVAPLEISRVFKFGSAQLVDDAIVPEKHSSPSKAKNTLIGGFLGGVISVMYIACLAIFNQKIYEPSDYEQSYKDIPLIGIIPDRIGKQY